MSLNITLSEICNNNTKNMPSDDVYDVFNKFMFSNDIKLLGKMLHRYNFFKDTINIPGDIVEIGVFKGSGVATFTKFIEIFAPNSNKKVIGFDIFSKVQSEAILDKDGALGKESMQVVYSKVNENELTLSNVKTRLDNMNINNKYILVEGDVEDTLPKFLVDNPGFRISLLYIDVDLERPTYNALKYLWNRILPGGAIVFDEYEYHKFSESTGVEKFLKEFNLDYNLVSTNWLAPTSYMIKKYL
jgi:hypothetical protein